MTSWRRDNDRLTEEEFREFTVPQTCQIFGHSHCSTFPVELRRPVEVKIGCCCLWSWQFVEKKTAMRSGSVGFAARTVVYVELQFARIANMQRGTDQVGKFLVVR